MYKTEYHTYWRLLQSSCGSAAVVAAVEQPAAGVESPVAVDAKNTFLDFIT